VTVKVGLAALDTSTPGERCEVVVDASQVETYSKLGYQTIQICDEQTSKLEFYTEHVVTPGGGSYPQPVSNSMPLAIKQLKFFMVKDGASRIAELSKELDECKASAKELVTTIVKHEGTIAGFTHNTEALKRDMERRRVALEEDENEIRALRKRLNLMEGDIAKFRKEIGERRWREITSSEEAKPST
jgi:hypothetical protein